MRYVALDVHQRYCEGAELVGGKLRRFRFPNTHEDWARLASDLTPDTRVVPEEIILGSCLKLIGELDREVAALEGEIYERANQIPEVKLLLRVAGLDVINISHSFDRLVSG